MKTLWRDSPLFPVNFSSVSSGSICLQRRTYSAIGRSRSSAPAKIRHFIVRPLARGVGIPLIRMFPRGFSYAFSTVCPSKVSRNLLEARFTIGRAGKRRGASSTWIAATRQKS